MACCLRVRCFVVFMVSLFVFIVLLRDQILHNLHVIFINLAIVIEIL
jgi:hypothetical protein